MSTLLSNIGSPNPAYLTEKTLCEDIVISIGRRCWVICLYSLPWRITLANIILIIQAKAKELTNYCFSQRENITAPPGTWPRLSHPGRYRTPDLQHASS